MKSIRKTSIGLGATLIVSPISGILNTVPTLEYPGYLERLAGIESQVLIAAFFQAIMAVDYVLIAALSFSLIRKHNGILGTAYLGLRMIGAGFLFVGIGSLLLLQWFGQSVQSVGEANSTYARLTGELLRRGRDFGNHIGVILPWSVGGIILPYCLYKTKFIPTWLSFWGIAGSALTLLATLAFMLNFIKMFSAVYIIANMPAALFEIAFAFFLLFKGGADSTESRSETARSA